MLHADQKYDIYMSSEQRGFRKLNILHETEIIGKQRSDDFDEQMKDQSSRVASKVASKASLNIS